MRIFRSLALAALLAGVPAASPAQQSERTPKLLLIGIDGIRVDILASAQTPHLDALAAGGAFSAAARTRPNTVSGPGWSSMVTGVWMDKHGVEDNDFTPSHYDRFPDFLTRIEQVRPELSTLAVLDWPPLGTVADGGPLIGPGVDVVVNINGDSLGYGPADALAARLAARHLRDGDPDATFVYLGNPDVAAHDTTSFAPEYRAAIEAADDLVGELVAAIRSRPTYANEDWLILSSTDHGRDDEGGHGGTSETELTIYYLASGPRSVPLDSTVEIVDIACTALTYFNIAIDPAWDLDCKANGIR